MAKSYWQNLEDGTTDVQNGFNLDARGSLALSLVEKWGMVTGTRESDDTQGRAAYDLLPVQAVVERACAMAEQLFAALEEYGWIEPAKRTMAEAHERIGELRRITGQAEWSKQQTRLEAELVDR